MIVKVIFLLIASIRADFSSFSNLNFTFELEPVEGCVSERYRCNEFLERPCCDESNVCTFTGSIQGMAILACIKKQKLGDDCEPDLKCFSIPHALCNDDNKCECEDDYIEINKTACVALITSSCLRDDDCEIDNSICVDRKCTCKPGFFSLFNDHCQPTHLGEYCSSDHDCGDIEHAICSEKKTCVCRAGYSVKNNAICASNLGKYCKDNGCAPNDSFCENNVCRCKNGYIPSSDGSCMPTLITAFCYTDYDCKDPIHMECIENKCFCKKNRIVVNNSTCASLLLQLCYNDEDCAVENSVCIENKCKCKNDYLMENSTTCSQTPLGRTCAFDSDCGTIIPARCSADNKCICAMSYTNIENTKCELLLGAECSEEIPCVAENSVCVNHNCECKANFKTNLTNGICEPTLLGKYCNLAYECEDVFHMKCYENKCVCRANNVVVNFQCRSLLDGYCWSNEYCLTFNSECRDHQCECKKNYERILNDRCIPKRYGQICELDDDCRRLNVPCSEHKTCDLDALIFI